MQNKSGNHMFAKQRSVEIVKEEEMRKFSVRQWSAQNEENKKKGRPTIKLEEKDNDLVSNYYFKL